MSCNLSPEYDTVYSCSSHVSLPCFKKQIHPDQPSINVHFIHIWVISANQVIMNIQISDKMNQLVETLSLALATRVIFEHPFEALAI